MDKIRHFFYVHPIEQVIFGAVCIYIVWVLAMIVLGSRTRRIFSCCVAVLTIVLIGWYTVFGREAGFHGAAEFVPFSSFERSKEKPKIFRLMFMNLIMFMPFGLSLPFALPEKIGKKVIIAVGAGMALSVVIEFTQLVFNVGQFETDDIIMNTLGTAIGASSYAIVAAADRLIRRAGSD